MTRTIHLTEQKLAQVIKETINEMNFRAMNTGMYDTRVGNLGDAIDEIKEALSRYEGNEYDHHLSLPQGVNNNKLYQQAVKGLEAIERFFQRKQDQQENFEATIYDTKDATDKEIADIVRRSFPSYLEKEYPYSFSNRNENEDIVDKFTYYANEEELKQMYSQLSPRAQQFFEYYYGL